MPTPMPGLSCPDCGEDWSAGCGLDTRRTSVSDCPAHVTGHPDGRLGLLLAYDDEDDEAGDRTVSFAVECSGCGRDAAGLLSAAGVSISG